LDNEGGHDFYSQSVRLLERRIKLDRKTRRKVLSILTDDPEIKVLSDLPNNRLD